MAEIYLANDVVPRLTDPRVVGYFLDNELRWGRDHRSPRTLLEDYLALPVDAPGRITAVAWLEGNYGGDIDAFNLAWATDFVGNGIELLFYRNMITYQTHGPWFW